MLLEVVYHHLLAWQRMAIKRSPFSRGVRGIEGSGFSWLASRQMEELRSQNWTSAYRCPPFIRSVTETSAFWRHKGFKPHTVTHTSQYTHANTNVHREPVYLCSYICTNIQKHSHTWSLIFLFICLWYTQWLQPTAIRHKILSWLAHP